MTAPLGKLINSMTSSELYPKIPFITAFLNYLVELFMAVAPHDSFSNRTKRILLRWRGAKVGAEPKIWRDVWIDDYRKLVIGDYLSIGKSAMLLCIGGITIGNNVMIAHGAQLISAGHRIPTTEETMRFSGLHVAPIVIEDDVWIGAGAIILPGVTVKRGAVVAAGAVVTHDVEEYSIVGGVPAQVIRKRETQGS